MKSKVNCTWVGIRRRVLTYAQCERKFERFWKLGISLVWASDFMKKNTRGWHPSLKTSLIRMDIDNVFRNCSPKGGPVNSPDPSECKYIPFWLQLCFSGVVQTLISFTQLTVNKAISVCLRLEYDLFITKLFTIMKLSIIFISKERCYYLQMCISFNPILCLQSLWPLLIYVFRYPAYVTEFWIALKRTFQESQH